MTYLLSVSGLSIGFPGHQAVQRLSFTVKAGEAVAIVGESGSGKSVTALSLMRLLPRAARLTEGQILFDGRDLTRLPDHEMRDIRGKDIAMVFQEPMTSLNPVMSVGDQLCEVILRHNRISRRQAWQRAIEALELVKIKDPAWRVHQFPHQLSGGQRQRVMIAIAIACNPRLLIADEPTTALDASVQTQILKLLDDLRRKLSMALVLITHDLGLVSRWTDRVIVMHHGEKLDEFPTARLHDGKRHAYTNGLMAASLDLDSGQHYSAATLAEVRVSKEDDGFRYDLLPAQARSFKPTVEAGPPLLSVEQLSVDYRSGGRSTRAVDSATLQLGRNETLGIVGESGSGKSSLSRAIMRLISPSQGRIVFDGTDIANLKERDLRTVRPRLHMIFQDPFGSLNPRKTIQEILEAPLAVHGVDDRQERTRRTYEMLDRVGLPRRSAGQFPHEFSGGQRQRIGIARALILRPSLVICDEPVSALDVSIQAQVLNLLVELREALSLSYLFISHDLAVVQYISDRIIVMKDARIVEESDWKTIWTAPRHDYTRQLIDAARGEGHVRQGAPATLAETA